MHAKQEVVSEADALLPPLLPLKLLLFLVDDPKAVNVASVCALRNLEQQPPTPLVESCSNFRWFLTAFGGWLWKTQLLCVCRKLFAYFSGSASTILATAPSATCSRTPLLQHDVWLFNLKFALTTMKPANSNFLPHWPRLCLMLVNGCAFLPFLSPRLAIAKWKLLGLHNFCQDDGANALASESPLFLKGSGGFIFSLFFVRGVFPSLLEFIKKKFYGDAISLPYLSERQRSLGLRLSVKLDGTSNRLLRGLA